MPYKDPAKARAARRARYEATGRSAYLASYDPDAVRVANLRAAHGITPAEKQAMLDAQDGRCYLCGDPLAYDDAVIDHDHRCCSDFTASGRHRTTSCRYCRRGLACGGCNTLIGMVRDDPERLRRIAAALAAALAGVAEALAARPQQLALDVPGATAPGAAPTERKQPS